MIMCETFVQRRQETMSRTISRLLALRCAVPTMVDRAAVQQFVIIMDEHAARIRMIVDAEKEEIIAPNGLGTSGETLDR
jgi:hypothetical protein